MRPIEPLIVALPALLLAGSCFGDPCADKARDYGPTYEGRRVEGKDGRWTCEVEMRRTKNPESCKPRSGQYDVVIEAHVGECPCPPSASCTDTCLERPVFPALGTVMGTLDLGSAPPVVSIPALERHQPPGTTRRVDVFLLEISEGHLDCHVEVHVTPTDHHRPTPGHPGDLEWRGLDLRFGIDPAEDFMTARWFWSVTGREYRAPIRLVKRP